MRQKVVFLKLNGFESGCKKMMFDSYLISAETLNVFEMFCMSHFCESVQLSTYRAPQTRSFKYSNDGNTGNGGDDINVPLLECECQHWQDLHH